MTEPPESVLKVGNVGNVCAIVCKRARKKRFRVTIRRRSNLRLLGDEQVCFCTTVSKTGAVELVFTLHLMEVLMMAITAGEERRSFYRDER